MDASDDDSEVSPRPAEKPPAKKVMQSAAAAAAAVTITPDSTIDEAKTRLKQNHVGTCEPSGGAAIGPSVLSPVWAFTDYA